LKLCILLGIVYFETSVCYHFSQDVFVSSNDTHKSSPFLIDKS